MSECETVFKVICDASRALKDIKRVRYSVRRARRKFKMRDVGTGAFKYPQREVRP